MSQNGTPTMVSVLKVKEFTEMYPLFRRYLRYRFFFFQHFQYDLSFLFSGIVFLHGIILSIFCHFFCLIFGVHLSKSNSPAAILKQDS